MCLHSPDHQHSRNVVVADAKNSATLANKPAIRTGDLAYDESSTDEASQDKLRMLCDGWPVVIAVGVVLPVDGLQPSKCRHSPRAVMAT